MLGERIYQTLAQYFLDTNIFVNFFQWVGRHLTNWFFDAWFFFWQPSLQEISPPVKQHPMRPPQKPDSRSWFIHIWWFPIMGNPKIMIVSILKLLGGIPTYPSAKIMKWKSFGMIFHSQLNGESFKSVLSPVLSHHMTFPRHGVFLNHCRFFDWSVVYLPLWKTWKSIGIIIPIYYGKKKSYSKPPTK